MEIEWMGVAGWFACDTDGVYRMVTNQRAEAKDAYEMAEAKGMHTVFLLEALPAGAKVVAPVRN